MTEKRTRGFDMLEAENARLRAALSDCNHGLNSMATKLTVCGEILGFSADQSVDEIRAVLMEWMKA